MSTVGAANTPGHTKKISPCGVAGLSSKATPENGFNMVESAQPQTIKMKRDGMYTSYEEVNTFSVIRNPAVNYVRFTIKVEDNLGATVMSPTEITIGTAVGTVRRHQRRVLARREAIKAHNRKLLKGWGRSGGSYASFRRRTYSSFRRRAYGAVYFGSDRRRNYARMYYVSGQPSYYNSRKWHNPVVVGATYGVVQQRLADNCAAGTVTTTQTGYTCDSKYYTSATASTMWSSNPMYVQDYSALECVGSCSGNNCIQANRDALKAKSATGSCTCTSCQTKTAYPALSTMKRDFIMGSGFIPNQRNWPLKVTIANLVYQKSITGLQSYSTASLPEQDLYFVYGEVDSTITQAELGKADAGAKLGVAAGLAAASAAYFGQQ
jgi:hypothetical protein